VIRREESAPIHAHSRLAIEAQVRIRDELHAIQVGLNLLRSEMLSGDLHGADLTYATIQHCLCKLSNDAVLASARGLQPVKTGW
jgi:hypothetical protein